MAIYAANVHKYCMFHIYVSYMIIYEIMIHICFIYCHIRNIYDNICALYFHICLNA